MKGAGREHTKEGPGRRTERRGSAAVAAAPAVKSKPSVAAPKPGQVPEGDSSTIAPHELPRPGMDEADADAMLSA